MIEYRSVSAQIPDLTLVRCIENVGAVQPSDRAMDVNRVLILPE